MSLLQHYVHSYYIYNYKPRRPPTKRKKFVVFKFVPAPCPYNSNNTRGNCDVCSVRLSDAAQYERLLVPSRRRQPRRRL